MKSEERDKILEAIELVKKCHKYIPIAAYHKDDMSYRVLKECAEWYRSIDHDNLLASAAEITITQDDTSFLEPETAEDKTFIVDDRREVVAAGKFYDLLYEMRDNRMGHEIEINIPDDKDTWFTKVVVNTRTGMNESFNKISEIVGWWMKG